VRTPRVKHEQQIESLDIIPMEPSVEVGAIRKAAQNFGNLHDTVAKNVGMLLKLAVECCAQLAKQLRESPFLDATRMQKVQEYKAKVKCAMIYAGMVQYKVGLSAASVRRHIQHGPAHMRVVLIYTCTKAPDECV